ncbi:MAG: nitroreductase family protein, partial [Mailhella sp.]|nr:nitroreductase family protein [Mailhella sp.]
MKETLQDIKALRSCRKYLDQQISDEQLDAILEAGTWAPSGMGYQNSYICAVQDEETCRVIRNLNARIWGRDIDPYYGAP